MPASSWNYFVPYETDPAFALQRLREDVFARGEYKSFGDVTVSGPAVFSRKTTSGWRSTFCPPTPAHRRLDLSRLFVEWNLPPKSVNRLGSRPGSIRELLDRQAGAGTHSILDITGIASRPANGYISPLPQSSLVELFGSDMPAHSDIQQACDFGLLAKHIGRRWQGIYLTAFRDGLPDEIFFAGRSAT